MINIYEKHYYKYYVVIPLLLFAVSLFLLPGLEQGIDLKGGTSITVQLPPGSTLDIPALESALSEKNVGAIRTRSVENPVTGETGAIIEFPGNPDLLKARVLLKTSPEEAVYIAGQFVSVGEGEQYEPAELVQLAESQFRSEISAIISAQLGADENHIGIKEVGPAFSQTFWEQGQRALIIAFLLMAAIVFIAFRKIMPSLYVVSVAFADLVTAAGAMALFGIPLTLATIAALLMLIGYSVDSDVMLTSKVLKRKSGTVSKQVHEAMITGLTMTGTTLVVLVVLCFASYLSQIEVLFQISAVLLLGLFGDLVYTWLFNAVVLKWWATRKNL